MMRRAVLIVILAISVSVSAAAEPEVERPAVCLGSTNVFISPGVQLSSTRGRSTSIDPSSGITTGSLSACRGTVDGQPLDASRAGSFVFRATYGVGRLSDAIGYTCLGGSGEGRISFTFPLKNGHTLQRHGSMAWNRASAVLVVGGSFGHSSSWTFPFLFRPVEGDCLTTPLTVGWMTGAMVVSSSRDHSTHK